MDIILTVIIAARLWQMLPAHALLGALLGSTLAIVPLMATPMWALGLAGVGLGRLFLLVRKPPRP